MSGLPSTGLSSYAATVGWSTNENLTSWAAVRPKFRTTNSMTCQSDGCGSMNIET